LHEPRFIDLASAEVFATLLEEGHYLCSVRTMHRVLAENTEVRERRDQLRHPAYQKPELTATAPKQLWSWDITELLGPAKWTYCSLYAILDVYSRDVAGWMLAYRDSAKIAEKLIAETCARQGILPGQLTIHADRGSSMTSKPVAFLLSVLGVTKTHSRPYVSDDNPFSEAHFKTLKYRPDFPDRFNSIEHGRAFCGDFFPWYNNEHHHAGGVPPAAGGRRRYGVMRRGGGALAPHARAAVQRRIVRVPDLHSGAGLCPPQVLALPSSVATPPARASQVARRIARSLARHPEPEGIRRHNCATARHTLTHARRAKHRFR
jgi:transposase InsO family protein